MTCCNCIVYMGSIVVGAVLGFCSRRLYKDSVLVSGD